MKDWINMNKNLFNQEYIISHIIYECLKKEAHNKVRDMHNNRGKFTNYIQILAFIACRYISKEYYKILNDEWEKWQIPSTMDDSDIVPFVLSKRIELNTAIQYAKISQSRKNDISIPNNSKLRDYVLSKLSIDRVKLVMNPHAIY